MRLTLILICLVVILATAQASIRVDRNKYRKPRPTRRPWERKDPYWFRNDRFRTYHEEQMDDYWNNRPAFG